MALQQMIFFGSSPQFQKSSFVSGTNTKNEITLNPEGKDTNHIITRLSSKAYYAYGNETYGQGYISPSYDMTKYWNNIHPSALPMACRLLQESLQIWRPCNHSDFSCPICLQTATFPVETNCGHLFCGPCLITYWKHSLCLGAITCPLCRQKVILLDNISCGKQDKPTKQIVHDIRNYNKRFSGQPRPFADYLYDMPLFLTVVLRGIFTWDGLVWIFFLRVAVCTLGAIICLPSPFDTMPGLLCRILGAADDMVVVFLLLICTINIGQQILSDRVGMARSASRSMLLES